MFNPDFINGNQITLTNGETLVIEGFGEMWTNHTTRALVLLALINFILEHKSAPTVRELLALVREYQQAAKLETLSANSERSINLQLRELERAGYVYRTGQRRGPGGISRNYWPACLQIELVD